MTIHKCCRRCDAARAMIRCPKHANYQNITWRKRWAYFMCEEVRLLKAQNRSAEYGRAIDAVLTLLGAAGPTGRPDHRVPPDKYPSVPEHGVPDDPESPSEDGPNTRPGESD